MLPKPSTATFTGAVDGDKMSGAYEQSGYKGTWEATRQAAASAAPTAPAEGVTRKKRVTFKNGQYSLAGTLRLPEGSGPHPAVVLISGSGAQNRDEEIYGFRLFAILADALTRKGIECCATMIAASVGRPRGNVDEHVGDLCGGT